ncbi:MAG: hypothetical protein M3T96_11690 [Acidobacteriota bacterium]|nr:hypothetical protein [Acidobacteriota bacterium]
MKKLAENREQRIEEIKQRLLRDSFPRLEISVILLFTALTGFLVSFWLLHAGFSSMTLRYPVCIAVAYGVFLLLLRLWLALHNPHSKPESNWIDLPISHVDNVLSESGRAAFDFGGGGDFGGAGAGGSWDGVSPTIAGGDSSILDGVGLGFDLEEIGMIILAVIAVLGGLLATFYIVWIAPLLLAEILVDGVLITGLYHRVKKIERRHWLQTAVKKTLLPAVLAALFFSIAGFAMHRISPKARSIGEVWHQTNGEQK